MGRSMAPPAFQLKGGTSATQNPPPNPENPIQRSVKIFRDNKEKKDFHHEFDEKKSDSGNSNDNSSKDKTKTKAPTPAAADAPVHDADTQTVMEFTRILDQKVKLAYDYVISNPHLGKLKDLDGHTESWVESLSDSKTRSNSNIMSTRFGYVIESIACMLLPKTHAGYDVILQARRKHTRPDVVLGNKKGDLAWLDITASGSVGHINGKAGSWQNEKDSRFAVEVTYDSFKGEYQELADRAEQKRKASVGDKDNNSSSTSDKDAEKDILDSLGDIDGILKDMEEAKKLTARRREYFKALGRQLKPYFNEIREEAREEKENLNRSFKRFNKSKVRNQKNTDKDAQLSPQDVALNIRVPIANRLIFLLGLEMKSIRRNQVRRTLMANNHNGNQSIDTIIKFLYAEQFKVYQLVPSILKAMCISPSTYNLQGQTVNKAEGEHWLIKNDGMVPISPNDPIKVDPGRDIDHESDTEVESPQKGSNAKSGIVSHGSMTALNKNGVKDNDHTAMLSDGFGTNMMAPKLNFNPDAPAMDSMSSILNVDNSITTMGMTNPGNINDSSIPLDPMLSSMYDPLTSFIPINGIDGAGNIGPSIGKNDNESFDKLVGLGTFTNSNNSSNNTTTNNNLNNLNEINLSDDFKLPITFDFGAGDMSSMITPPATASAVNNTNSNSSNHNNSNIDFTNGNTPASTLLNTSSLSLGKGDMNATSLAPTVNNGNNSNSANNNSNRNVNNGNTSNVSHGAVWETISDAPNVPGYGGNHDAPTVITTNIVNNDADTGTHSPKRRKLINGAFTTNGVGAAAAGNNLLSPPTGMAPDTMNYNRRDDFGISHVIHGSVSHHNANHSNNTNNTNNTNNHRGSGPRRFSPNMRDSNIHASSDRRGFQNGHNAGPNPGTGPHTYNGGSAQISSTATNVNRGRHVPTSAEVHAISQNVLDMQNRFHHTRNMNTNRTQQQPVTNVINGNVTNLAAALNQFGSTRNSRPSAPPASPTQGNRMMRPAGMNRNGQNNNHSNSNHNGMSSIVPMGPGVNRPINNMYQVNNNNSNTNGNFGNGVVHSHQINGGTTGRMNTMAPFAAPPGPNLSNISTMIYADPNTLLALQQIQNQQRQAQMLRQRQAQMQQQAQMQMMMQQAQIQQQFMSLQQQQQQQMQANVNGVGIQHVNPTNVNHGINGGGGGIQIPNAQYVTLNLTQLPALNPNMNLGGGINGGTNGTQGGGSNFNNNGNNSRSEERV